MADTKISDMSAASTPLSGAELVPVVQSGANAKATADDMAPALRAEVVAARGSESSLSDRLAALEALISAAGGDGFIGWPSDAYFTTARNASAMSTIFGASNRLEVMPWQWQRTITLTQFSLYCTNTGAGAFRLLIYESDANGLPGDLYWSSADTIPSSTGEIVFSPPGGITFQAGKTYWYGWHTESSGAGTHRAIAIAAVASLGLTGIAGAQGCQVLRTTAVAFASGAPDPFPAVDASMLTQSTTPLAFLFKAP